MGTLYVVPGIAYLTGFVNRLKHPLGLALGRLSGGRGAVALGMSFELNIPACAGPLLVALPGAAAVTESSNAVGVTFILPGVCSIRFAMVAEIG